MKLGIEVDEIHREYRENIHRRVRPSQIILICKSIFNLIISLLEKFYLNSVDDDIVMFVKYLFSIILIF